MAAKRLIKELDAYNRDPSAAVAELYPLHDDNLFELRAVLRGPEGTGYEGTPSHKLSVIDTADTPPLRRTFHPLPLPPGKLPLLPTHGPLPDARHPPQRLLHVGRDLLGPAEEQLDAGVRGCQYVGGGAAVAGERRGGGESVES